MLRKSTLIPLLLRRSLAPSLPRLSSQSRELRSDGKNTYKEQSLQDQETDALTATVPLEEANASSSWQTNYNGQQPSRIPFNRDDPPDVWLDVPNLSVDEIKLNVQNLNAHLSLTAKVAGLVSIDAGVDVNIDKVELTITGVKAELQLAVRLGNLVKIVERTLDALDKNPQLLTGVLNAATSTLNQVPSLVSGVTSAVPGALNAVTSTLNGVASAVPGALNAATSTVPGALNAATSTVNAGAGAVTDGVQHLPGSSSSGSKRPNNWLGSCTATDGSTMHHIIDG
ncbi:unnamed protein product, partial [Didymodactylos carnosus]